MCISLIAISKCDSGQAASYYSFNFTSFVCILLGCQIKNLKCHAWKSGQFLYVECAFASSLLLAQVQRDQWQLPNAVHIMFILSISCNSSPGGKVLRSSCSSGCISRGLRQKSWSNAESSSYITGMNPDLGFCRAHHRKLLL